MQVHPRGESSPRGLKKAGGGEEDKMAKLLRERSTAQKRRQCKREELSSLGCTVQELELKLAKLQTQVDALTPPMRAQVLAAQARAGVPPLGCRLCSVLDRADEYTSVERLLQHFRLHHASDVRNKGDDFELIRFGTDIPAEDAEGSDNDDNDSDDDLPESFSPSLNPAGEANSDLKKKLRLKRNAASARKSRKRKRVQLERWRMLYPMLKFQVITLENALTSLSFPRNLVQPFDAEPDVVSAAFALIGCSLSAPKTMT